MSPTDRSQKHRNPCLSLADTHSKLTPLHDSTTQTPTVRNHWKLNSKRKNLHLLQEGKRGQLNEPTGNFRNALILYDTHPCESPGPVLQRHKHFSCEQAAARFLPRILAHPKRWSSVFVFSHLILQTYSRIHHFPWTTF